MVPATPVNVEVGLLGVAMLPPAPEMMLHAPVPEKGGLAARVVEVPQTPWSGPALAKLGAGMAVTVKLALAAHPSVLVPVTV